MTEHNERSSLVRSQDVLTPEEEILIERLVDDELNEEERDALFLRLEESVDGWRTCALRFLEAQTFRAALRRFDDRLTPRVASTSTSNAAKKRNLRGFVKTFSATAAGFLVAALFFGRFENDRIAPPYDSGARLVLNESPKEKSSSASSNAVVDLTSPEAPSTPIRENVSIADVPLKSSSIASVEVAGLDRSKMKNAVEVKLNCPEQGLTNVAIPCTECDSFDRVGFLTSNSDVPPNVAEELRRSGGTVTSRRYERRFQLGDGRVLIIPIDAYNVDYNSNLRVY